MNKDEKIHFRDLDTWLKTAIVCAYIIVGFYVLSFIIGMIIGYTTA